jgi:hypothetical protein
MAEHSTLLSIDCHEPRGITNALVADAGKVITPSSVTAGTSTLRKLNITELTDNTLLVSSLSGAVVADAGKVVTPSSVTPGTTLLRRLDVTELTDTTFRYTIPTYGGKIVNGNTTVIVVPDAVDSTLNTASDYVAVTGIYSGTNEPSLGLTVGTNDFTILTTGVYQLHLWMNLSCDDANTTVGIRHTVNGVIATDATRVFLGTVNQISNLSSHRLVTLTAGQVIALRIAADNPTNALISNAHFSAILVDRTA